jgi:hypothetical protein
MEPASWFMVWTGMEALLYNFRVGKKETAFYETMAKLEIRFGNI